MLYVKMGVNFMDPKDHFGKVWFLLSLVSAEFFAFRTDGHFENWIVNALMGSLFMYVTFLPALGIVALIYAACGWMD